MHVPCSDDSTGKGLLAASESGERCGTEYEFACRSAMYEIENGPAALVFGDVTHGPLVEGSLYVGAGDCAAEHDHHAAGA